MKSKNLISWIQKELDRLGSNNISLCLGSLDSKTIAELSKHFKVEKEFLGYFKFTRKNKKEN